MLPVRIESSAALFQSVTTSAFAGMPMLDARFYRADIGDEECAFQRECSSVCSFSFENHYAGTRWARCPVLRFSWLLCSRLIPDDLSTQEDACRNIGNDFLDFGAGNSRSKLPRSSSVSLISIDRALSQTCFSLFAFGITITSGSQKNTQASAICDVVATRRSAILVSVTFSSDPRP